MFNRDTLQLISSHLDNRTLQILSQTSLWNSIRTFAKTEYFWKLRVEHLVGRNLADTTENWKNIYYILEEALKEEEPFDVVDTSSITALEILYDLGHTPREYEPGEYGEPLLYRAIENEHTETVKFLLAQGEDPSDPRHLIAAVGSNNVEVVRILLDDPRVDPEEEYDEDISVLAAACENGYLEIVKLLLEDGRIDPSDNDNEALAAASGGGYLDVVKLLLEDERVIPTGTSIIVASAGGHPEIVKLLLRDGRADPSSDENEALRAASAGGHLRTVKILLSDYRVRVSNGEGNNSLRDAVLGEHIEVVELLLSYGVRDTVISFALESHSPEIIELLLKNSRFKPNKGTLLLAVERNNTVLVSILLKKYPSIDPSFKKTSFKENEALTVACRMKSDEMVRLLLSDSRVRSLNMDEVLKEACEYGNIEIVQALLTNPLLDPSANHNAAMQLAMDIKNRGVIDLLLKDKRVDLDQLIQDVDFKNLLEIIFPLIREKALGFYSSGITSGQISPYHRSLALLLILRRPTFEEALRWILLHPDSEMRAAARSLISGRIDHRSPLLTSYLGFLLLAVPGMDLEKITKLLHNEGATKQGIDLARSLIGAFLGG